MSVTCVTCWFQAMTSPWSAVYLQRHARERRMHRAAGDRAPGRGIPGDARPADLLAGADRPCFSGSPSRAPSSSRRLGAIGDGHRRPGCGCWPIAGPRRERAGAPCCMLRDRRRAPFWLVAPLRGLMRRRSDVIRLALGPRSGPGVIAAGASP